MFNPTHKICWACVACSAVCSFCLTISSATLTAIAFLLSPAEDSALKWLCSHPLFSTGSFNGLFLQLSSLSRHQELCPGQGWLVLTQHSTCQCTLGNSWCNNKKLVLLLHILQLSFRVRGVSCYIWWFYCWVGSFLFLSWFWFFLIRAVTLLLECWNSFLFLIIHNQFQFYQGLYRMVATHFFPTSTTGTGK